jgi:hypothetical protein
MKRNTSICEAYPKEILELISEKRKQREKWHQTR